MCPAPCSWTWSRAPWTLCARGPSGRSSGRTTSSSVSRGSGWVAADSQKGAKVGGGGKVAIFRICRDEVLIHSVSSVEAGFQDALLPSRVTQSPHLKRLCREGPAVCREGADRCNLHAGNAELEAVAALLLLGVGRGCPWEGLVCCLTMLAYHLGVASGSSLSVWGPVCCTCRVGFGCYLPLCHLAFVAPVTSGDHMPG